MPSTGEKRILKIVTERKSRNYLNTSAIHNKLELCFMFRRAVSPPAPVYTFKTASGGYQRSK